MRRREFVRLLAGAASASSIQRPPGLPPLGWCRVSAAKEPGMPGPYPGRVVSVASDKSVDVSTGAATTRSCAR